MAAPAVTLGNSLLAASGLRPHVHDGLGALPKGDRALIAVERRPEIGDSLDLDQAMEATHPEDNRWDYLLSVPHAQRIVGLEPHSARDDEVSVVMAKKESAQTYLVNHLPAHRRVSAWYWVSSGAVRFSRMETASRRLAKKGILFVGRELTAFE